MIIDVSLKHVFKKKQKQKKRIDFFQPDGFTTLDSVLKVHLYLFTTEKCEVLYRIN